MTACSTSPKESAGRALQSGHQAEETRPQREERSEGRSTRAVSFPRDSETRVDGGLPDPAEVDSLIESLVGTTKVLHDVIEANKHLHRQKIRELGEQLERLAEDLRRQVASTLDEVKTEQERLRSESNERHARLEQLERLAEQEIKAFEASRRSADEERRRLATMVEELRKERAAWQEEVEAARVRYQAGLAKLGAELHGELERVEASSNAMMESADERISKLEAKKFLWLFG